MKKTILAMVLGLVCLGAYADQAEAPIAAYADNPNQPGSEAAEVRGEEIQAGKEVVDSGLGNATDINPTNQGNNNNPNVETVSADPASAECSVVIEGTDQMKFDLDSFTVAQDACAEFTITLKHVGNLPVAAMGHNVVVSRAGDMDGVVADGISAGLDNEYVKPDDDRVIAMTLMIGGGEESSITFNTEKLDAGAEYMFYCTFPGHASMMKGTVTVTAD